MATEETPAKPISLEEAELLLEQHAKAAIGRGQRDKDALKALRDLTPGRAADALRRNKNTK